jgi:FtsH-binding integral membrane protein
VPLFGTLIVLGLLYWKRHSHPANLGLLGLFTLMEAFTLGIVTASFEDVIVLQALLITTGVFLGLTLFTMQSKVGFLVCILLAAPVTYVLSMISPGWGHGYLAAFSLWVKSYAILP